MKLGNDLRKLNNLTSNELMLFFAGLNDADTIRRANLPTYEEMCENTDDRLLNKTLAIRESCSSFYHPTAILASQHHSFRPRLYNISLSCHDNYLSDYIIL